MLIISSKGYSMQYSDKSMYRHFADNTAHLPDSNKSISYFGRTVPKGEFFRHCDKLAAYLRSIGAGKGRNVVLCLPNIPDAIVAFYAINKTGAIVNAVHPLVTGQALADFIKGMDACAAVIFEEFYPGYKQYLEGLNVPLIVASAADYLPAALRPLYKLKTAKAARTVPYGDKIVRYADVIKGKAGSVPDVGKYPDIKGSDIAVYMHSGGTTGASKTVMLDNSAFNCLAENALALIGGKPVDDRDGMLMVLPIFHTFGLGICMHTTICAGGQVVLMPRFDPVRACKLLKSTSATFISGVPNMFAKMLDCGYFKGKYISRLKHCYCGGDKLSNSVKERFYEATKAAGNPIRLNEGYGLTEAGICCVNTPENYREGSIGKPFKNTRFGIFDDEDKPVACDTVGNLCISSNTMMTGYYGDEEATQNAFFEYDGAKWVRTGDMGRIDSDGFVYFVDRKKRVIKISGNNVFPQEIENVVNKVEGVRRSCVVSMTDDGKPAVRLIIQPEEGADEKALEQKVVTEIKAKLLKYAIPRVVEFRSRLPLTQIGKVDYRKLEETGGENA